MYVFAFSDSRLTLPRRISSSSGKKPPLPPMKFAGPPCVYADVVLPISAVHSACTWARFGFAAMLPYAASVLFAHGSDCGKPATVVVGPVNSSAVFGARLARW